MAAGILVDGFTEVVVFVEVAVLFELDHAWVSSSFQGSLEFCFETWVPWCLVCSLVLGVFGVMAAAFFVIMSGLLSGRGVIGVRRVGTFGVGQLGE